MVLNNRESKQFIRQHEILALNRKKVNKCVCDGIIYLLFSWHFGKKNRKGNAKKRQRQKIHPMYRRSLSKLKHTHSHSHSIRTTNQGNPSIGRRYIFFTIRSGPSKAVSRKSGCACANCVLFGI